MIRAERSKPCRVRNQLFSARPRQQKGSGAPKGALSYQCPRSSAAARNLFARPPFGAHARGTRHRLLPRWLSPRTGFPATLAAGVLPASPKMPRLSTLRADRSLCRSTGDPGPPGCGLANSARGHRIPLRCYGMPSGTAPLNKRDGGGYRHCGGKVKGVSISPLKTGVDAPARPSTMSSRQNKDGDARHTRAKRRRSSNGHVRA